MAATSNSYLRYPHIAGDLLTFVAEEDVWLAPATGGRATRLTSDRAAPLPRLSPDGRYVAWASARKGGNEAYAVSVDGGPVVQLTNWGSEATTVIGWLSAEEVIVIGPAESRSRQRGRPWAYAVRLDGSSRLLPYGPLRDLSTSPDGAVLVGSVYSAQPAWWKRYRGGSGGKLWFDRTGSGEFEPVLREVGGNLVDSMLVGDRIAFLSDHEGIGALYSTDRDLADLRRHTDLGEFYARHAATDGTRVVYERAGELYLLQSLDDGAEPVRLEISLPGGRVGREPFSVDTGEWLGEIALSKDGRAAAAEVRGTVHWLPVEQGPARTVLAEPGVRGRLPVVVPGGNAVLCVSDSGGEDGLDLVPTDGGPARRIGQGRIGRAYDLAVAPDGKTAAVSSEDGRLLLVDLGESAEEPISELTRAELDEPRQLAFSPDSGYLAWAQVWAAEGLDSRSDTHVRLARLSDATIVDVTEPRFHSHSPVFTHDGTYLALLSDQTYDPVYDGKLFDLGFPPGVRPYLVTLTDGTPSPFAPEIDGRPAAAGAAEGEDAKTGDVQVQIDLDGIAERLVPFPVEAGDYRQLRAVKDGVAWMAHREQGVLGETWRGSADQPPKPQLVRYDLAKRKRSVLVTALDAYAASPDGSRIAYRTDGSLKVKAADATDEDATIGVDLDRIHVRVDPVAEWTQMYDETWRLHRDNFWRPDMAGIDWVGMAERYRPLIGRLGGYDDFIDLLWELNGELGYSHAYAIPAVWMNPPTSGQGLLGADLTPGPDGRWLIDRVPPGESSVIEARSPLAAPGVRARAGEQIAAVDGRPVDPLRGPNPLLVGKAGRPVELTLRAANGDVGGGGDGGGDGPTGGVERRVAVVPLGSEALLRYHDRISARRAAVRESSGGRLGYLHVPDMQSLGWAEFHRGFTAELARDGLVLDLRENGGGHTSALVVEKLVRRVIGWVLGRQAGITPYPHDAPRGPIVTLIDEQAGSDGDIGPNAIRTYGVGPLVGVRTWGGVVGYDRDRRLVDRTIVSQPKLACWFEGPGFGIENYGVDPDVEVAIRPQDWGAGRDPQLETAIRLALELLEQHPAATPPALPTD